MPFPSLKFDMGAYVRPIVVLYAATHFEYLSNTGDVRYVFHQERFAYVPTGYPAAVSLSKNAWAIAA